MNCCCTMAGSAACMRCPNNPDAHRAQTGQPAPCYTLIIDYDKLSEKLFEKIKEKEVKQNEQGGHGWVGVV